METGAGDGVDTREENKDNREVEVSESQVILSSSTREEEAPTNTENGYSDQFGAARTINSTMEGIQQTRDFMSVAILDMQSKPQG